MNAKPLIGDTLGTLKLAGTFALHTIAGVLLFLLVALAAVAVNYFRQAAEHFGVSEWIVEGLDGAEYFLFAVDIVCLVAFILKEAATFVGSLWREWKKEGSDD